MRAAVIVAITANPALAAKAATATIPIVFNIADDPVELGLVASLPRPGGNATGVSFLFSDLVAKHLGLLRELLPTAARFGMLINPQSANAENLSKNATAAAAATGVEIIVVRRRSGGDRGCIRDAGAATDGCAHGGRRWLFILRITATILTFGNLPAALKRSWKTLSTEFQLLALIAAM